MQVQFLVAVGANFGQRPEASPRPAPAGTVIDAVPLEISEKRAPLADRATLRGATPFRGRGATNDKRAALAPPVRLSPQPVVFDRRPRPGVSPPLRASGHRHSTIDDTAFLAPPGYDAGLRSSLPTLLDVTV